MSKKKKHTIVDLDPAATKAGKTENCPTCGARVASIFDHVDGCPQDDHVISGGEHEHVKDAIAEATGITD